MYLQNGAGGKLYSTNRLTTFVVRSYFADGEFYQGQKLDSEKSNIAELRSIEFLACALISVRHAYRLRANDFQWRSASMVLREWHITGLGMTEKGVLSPSSKVTVRQVALLANLRIHTDAVNAAPVCSDCI
jgi:hypothetical protein